ncbi:hypothetical protein AVEN_159067-1 [Araneus ventricosus]|uniref:Uncharacterized protein n=1 Tax=Araneus ventricosus TaxID=182803 RepID=A0A4Y2BBJ4_ARAVE|nr:hypothetical protein AVEN_159067-1 [Araneus ventricosus]
MYKSFFGIFFQKSPVSSQLKTAGDVSIGFNPVRKSFEIIVSCFASELAASPCLTTVNAGSFLKLSNQPQLALNESSMPSVEVRVV